MNVTTTTETADTVQAVVHAAVAAGSKVKVNDREVWSRWNRNAPVSTWQNGSASVDVRGASRGTQGTVWVKAGQSCTVTVTA